MPDLQSSATSISDVFLTDTLDGPPPAYEDLSRPVSILSSYSDETLTLPTQPVDSRPFPLAFNLYFSKKFKFASTSFHLGEHAAEPSNFVILNAGLKGTTLTLHQGPDIDSPVLAIATAERGRTRHSIVTLPASSENEEPTVERLEFHAHFTSMRYNFTIRVPTFGDKPRAEVFEWRITHGAEVRHLDKRGWGWKLVRTASSPNTSIAGGKRSERRAGETSDGKEVVAVWADNSKPSRDKFGKFEFVGSAATGELGREWSIMAVISILRIWQNVRLGGGAMVASESSSAAAAGS